MQLLRINLTEKVTSEVVIDTETETKYLGGRGIGAHILYNELPPKTDPLSPDNKLLFLTSALSGTRVPCCPKVTVVTKSPLTNTILMSLAGGFFAARLRSTKYDGLILEGKLDKPGYLYLHDDQLTFGDAAHLWGKTTDTAQAMLKEELGDPKARTACIGPAAEQGVRYGAIMCDLRAAGRGGAGTVMASKNLKAIAVSGSRKPSIAQPDEFDLAVKEIRQSIKDSPKAKNFRMYGTPGVVSLTNSRGIFPTRNFCKPGIVEYVDEINGEARQKYIVKNSTCYRCPIACSKICVVDKGPFNGATTDGPEYETICTFGSLCENRDFSAIIAADEICDKYGMDTISAGNSVAFAMELYERGIIDKTDTDGLELSFGNSVAMVSMAKRIATRQGKLGKLLGEGVRIASQVIGQGTEDYAMHLKGMEWPAYDPRGAKAMAVTYASSPRGACHERGMVRQETFGAPPPIDNLATEGKAKLSMDSQDHTTIEDALGFCALAVGNGNIQIESIAKAYSAALGVSVSVEMLIEAAKRIWTLERMFNLREGFTRADDILPKRFLKKAHTYGPAKGSVVEIDELLDQYYEARGWDNQGVPTTQTLNKLGLG